jgi:hypothetical protein
MRRTLLANLDHGGQALDSAWAEFQVDPGKFTYEELIRYVPKANRAAWHERAMIAPSRATRIRLSSCGWLSAKEIGRLVERLDPARNSESEG